jgi:hypothetical protein
MRRFAGLLFASAVLFAAAPGQAEDFLCEVMTVEGTATLSNASVGEKALGEGDLLQVDDVVAVGPGSYVDLAYDRDWNNITRIEENSSIRLRSLYPTVVGLEEGAVFAKLKSLPQDTTFDVQTPTAVASVRGTEYRTTFAGGETQIYNVSDSDVYVYGFDDDGVKQPEPVVLRHEQKTHVERRGQAPMAPRKMEAPDIQRAGHIRGEIGRKVEQNIQRGRIGKIHDVGTLGRFHKEKMGREGGDPGRRRGAPETISGEQAAEKTKRMRSLEGGYEAEEKRHAERPKYFEQAGEHGNREAETGIGRPYFPGGEKHRSGGPEPVGLPDEKWKAGADEGKIARRAEGAPNQPQKQGLKKPENNAQKKPQARPAPRPQKNP